jgi:putative transposase
MNKNTVQRIFQLKGWQVKKRPVGFRPRVQTMSSAVPRPNQRRASNLCRIRAGNDGWRYRALMIDCCCRKLPGWHLSR